MQIIFCIDQNRLVKNCPFHLEIMQSCVYTCTNPYAKYAFPKSQSIRYDLSLVTLQQFN